MGQNTMDLTQGLAMLEFNHLLAMLLTIAYLNLVEPKSLLHLRLY